MNDMDLDPDIALPSVETQEEVFGATTPQGHRTKNVNATSSSRTTSRATSSHRIDSSPSRPTPFKTPRTRPSTPSTSSISRSSSVASFRNDRSSTPKLDKKRSVPNLTIRSSTPSHHPQFRRASSNLNPATPLKMKALERPQMTPTSVAQEYFRRELQSHSRTSSKTVVLVSDACYGHRFSRPRATKATLASIVERPERIHATVLGASAAYVRLGERHKDGRYSPHPYRECTTPPFVLVKTARSLPLSHPSVTAVHGTKWMESLQVMCDSAEAKLAMGQKELARPIGHNKDTRGNILPPLHSGDLYLSSESLLALQGCLGGVCDAVDLVYQQDAVARRAFVCIRPPGHHCSADMPSGFCWLNNVHIGISYAAMNHGLTHAAILDFDLHHGDGSQTITWDHNRDAHNMQNPKTAPSHKKIPIGYYSLHDINSYPCEYGDEDKVRNASTCMHMAHGQSIWNIHLESWKTHADFWQLYESKYKVLLDKAQSFLQHHSNVLREAGIEPKAAIFLSSGFDASEWEGEGMQRHQVNVPTDFYAKFTADVVALSEKPELGVGGRVVSVLEGGYSDRALTSGVLSHLCGLAQGVEQENSAEMQQGLSPVISDPVSVEIPRHDPFWWHQTQLELLEAVVSGHLPQPAGQAKEKPQSSYSSPTQASTAKMNEVAKERKSISAQLEARLAWENAPPEPVPEVDWMTAAYELSRLLIPSNRQTQSCTHEELNAENSRARRDRLSLASVPTSDIVEEKMQLRDRRSKVANAGAVQPKVTTKTTNRRTTIAAASDLPDAGLRQPSQARRRSSAGSSVVSGFHDLRVDDKQDLPSKRTLSRVGPTVPSKTDAPLPVRKTRAPVKKTVSATSSPRKSKPAASQSTQLGSVNETAVSVPTKDGNNLPENQDDMDDLTNSMKKISIKLKMPTEEEHNANQKRAEESGTAKPKPTRKPQVPKVPRAKPAPVSKATAAKPKDPSKEVAPGEVDPALPAKTHPQNSNNIHTPGATSNIQSVESSHPSNAKTMPALEFLSATGPQSELQPNRVDVIPDSQEEEEIQMTYPVQRSSQQFMNDVAYPSIDMKTESVSPPPADAFKAEDNQKGTNGVSVWDIPDTPRRT